MERGDIYYANLSPVVGSEQGGNRPVVIIQNDIGNKFSPTVIVAAITSVHKTSMPTHVQLDSKKYGLAKNSVVLLEQIRTIDKKRLTSKIGNLDRSSMMNVNKALQISLGMIDLGINKAV